MLNNSHVGSTLKTVYRDIEGRLRIQQLACKMQNHPSDSNLIKTMENL